MKIKNILCFSLTALTLFSGTAMADFSDTQGHWAKESIDKYVKNGHLNGYEDGTFKPDNGVTAAEFSKIVSSIKGVHYNILTGNWALPYIRQMINDSVFERTDYDDYNKKMTREEVAKAVTTLMAGEYYPKDLSQYAGYITDFADTGDKFTDSVLKAYVSGVLSGYDDDSWKPKQEVTRAELLSVLDRVYNKDLRQIPEALKGTTQQSPERSYYYNAAVQLRQNTSASSMQYRLYGSDAQYMEEDDPSTGLKMTAEIQGAQGFAMVLRYDVTDIRDNRDTLEKLFMTVNWVKGGTEQNKLGLWIYDDKADPTDWNNPLYYKNLNGSAVAGDDLSGYKALTSNITTVLPTWGSTSLAVPNDQKTQPLVSAPREDGKYVFDLTDSVDMLLDGAKDTVQLILTTVNYDDYNQFDDKPTIYTAGQKAPMLNAEYNIDGSMMGQSTTLTLGAKDAVLDGGVLDIEDVDGTPNIAFFVEGQQITFNINAGVAGDYLMKMNTSASQSAGGTVRFNLNGESFDHVFAPGTGWTEYDYSDIDTVHLEKGENTLVITGVKWNATYLINIRNVVFELTD